MKAKVPFYISFVNKLSVYVKQRKYEYLLFSFLLLIFGDTFSDHNHTINVFDIYQNFIVGLVIFFDKKWLRSFIICVILITVGLDIFSFRFAFLDLKSWHGILYLLFFSLVSKEVYKEVLYTKKVTRELLAAALCGFVLLCLIGTFVYYQIDIKLPHSFSVTGDKRDLLANLNYFSFTTILTIGYGDIVPLSLVAKRAVMMMGLAGHFYTVFITSIIIGKYLSNRKTESLQLVIDAQENNIEQMIYVNKQ